MSEENISSIKYANPSLMNGEAKCPVSHGSSDQHTNRAQTNKEWWPESFLRRKTTFPTDDFCVCSQGNVR